MTPGIGVAPLSVSAHVNAYFGDRGNTFSFDFGDGSPLIGPRPQAGAVHTYTFAGTFTVTVTVTASDGRSRSTTSQVTVAAANTGFESGTSGWNASGSSSGVTLARVSGGHGGAWAAQLANGGTAAASCVLNDAPNWVATTGGEGRYVASLWVRSDAPGAIVKLKLREYRKDNGAFVGAGSSAVTLTTSWQQVTVEYTPLVPGASTLDYTAEVTKIDAGSTCFYADDAAIGFKPAPAATLASTLTPATSFGSVPTLVRADASASSVTDLPIASYIFNFGDGSPLVGPQAEPTAEHTYWAPGSYLIIVRVTDTDGRSSSAVNGNSLNPSFIYNSAFDWGTQGWNTSGSSAEATVTEVFGGHSPNRQARLKNGGTTAGSCVLNDAPNAVQTTPSGRFLAWVWVRADAPGGTLKLRLREYRKDTGALVGETKTAATLTTSWQMLSLAYAALAPGASTLDYSVYVDDVAAGSTCFYADDAILEFDPAATALVSVTPATGTAPLAVRADASASTSWGATIASYRFDFGDGSPVVGPQTEPVAEHTYTFGGTYTVTLTVTDTAGRSATTTRQVTLKGGIVSNSSFEASTSGWNAAGSGAGVTLTRIAGGHSGAWAAQLANGGTTTASCVLNDAPNWLTTTAAAGRYTGSLWVRADAPGATLKLKLREYRKDNGAFIGEAKSAITLTTTWQQITVDYTPLAPGASTLDYTAYIEKAAAASVCFDADDASIVPEAAPTGAR